MRKAAEEGDAQAQSHLGVSYQNGQGRGARLYGIGALVPARGGSERSGGAMLPGFCFLSGHGVPQELGEAARWFREAAEQGDPAAMFNLGILYETGRACRKIMPKQ